MRTWPASPTPNRSSGKRSWRSSLSHSSRRTDLPHVTDILRDAGLVSHEWVTDWHRERGSVLHRATALLDEGDLDPETIDPAIEVRLRQYDRWKQESGYGKGGLTIEYIEHQVEHPVYRYCGTLDRTIMLNGHEGVLDIKGPTQDPAGAIQTAAYAACFRRLMKRWTLHLSDDDYRLVEHTDRSDFKVFLAALAVAQWRRTHGLT